MLCDSKLPGRLCIVALFSASACASVDVGRLKPAVPKPEDCQLETYAESKDVNRPYEVVCVIGSSTGGSIFNDRSIEYALELVRPEACKCGADAILIDTVGASSMSRFSMGKGSASVKAIAYKKPAD